jgi:hypothetical protein
MPNSEDILKQFEDFLENTHQETLDALYRKFDSLKGDGISLEGYIKHKYMITEMPVQLESRPDLEIIIDKLKAALDRYEELLISTRRKLSMIRSYEEDEETGAKSMEVKPESATEEIKILLCRFTNLNQKAALNYDHLDKIV